MHSELIRRPEPAPQEAANDPHGTIVAIRDGRAVTSSIAIARGTETQHKNVLELVRTYMGDLEEFGGVTFETRPFDTPGGQQIRQVAMLNEQQATLLLTYMRNSDIVRQFKKALVKAFYEMAARRFDVPTTLSGALRLAAEQAEKIEQQAAALEAAAPKVGFYDRVVQRDTLMTATQVGQKLKLSAVHLNQLLDKFDVYHGGIKRGRAFKQWFIDKGYGIMKQTDAGYPQPLFTPAGDAWVMEKLIGEGY